MATCYDGLMARYILQSMQTILECATLHLIWDYRRRVKDIHLVLFFLEQPSLVTTVQFLSWWPQSCLKMFSWRESWLIGQGSQVYGRIIVVVAVCFCCPLRILPQFTTVPFLNEWAILFLNTVQQTGHWRGSDDGIFSHLYGHGWVLD